MTMTTRTQAFIRRITTSAKTAIRAVSRIVKPAPNSMPANCTNINSLLMHLCDFDQRTYCYLVKWLAYPLQNPGAKMQHAILINGQQGTGCSVFFNHVMAGIYTHAFRAIYEEDMGASNGWADGARFAVVETERPEKLPPSAKTLIASPTITIRRAYAKAGQLVTNQLNFVFLSESDNFLPLSAADRRFFVVEAPPKREKLFYAAIIDEINAGGIEAFRDYLLNGVDLVNFNQFSEPPRLAITERMEVA
jgi:putative DNA primase/helicase